MFWFALFTCLPVVLIAAAAVFAGPWPVMAMLSLTLLVAGIDHMVAKVTAPDAVAGGKGANLLAASLGVIHLGLLPLVIWALAGDVLGTLDKVFVFVSMGIFCGQISNANAHELIHRQQRGLFCLGVWVYGSMLFGHHVSAHLLIHHRYVGTAQDPGTARLGQSYYDYMTQAWVGAFHDGLRAETLRLQQVQRPWTDHPFLGYAIVSAVFLILSAMIGGWIGLAWFLGIIIFAQQQLLLCDYVQHYGLVRQTCADGRLEPVGDRHSWNAPHWYSSQMMLHAPRHSDHHTHPYRPFPELALPRDGPTLPRSVPVMAVLALFPPIWRGIMDHRARDWQVVSGT